MTVKFLEPLHHLVVPFLPSELRQGTMKMNLGQQQQNFYVDDGLISIETVKEAVGLVRNVKEMCKWGDFNLHKFTSNSKAVQEQFSIEDRANELKTSNLSCDTLPFECALGVSWCAQSDVFKFHIVLKDHPYTCTRCVNHEFDIRSTWLHWARPFRRQTHPSRALPK